ncbi:hypothetical protein ABIB77_000316 [Bradyrhizobium sp. i1.14.1]
MDKLPKENTGRRITRCFPENAVCEIYFSEPAIVLNVPLKFVPTPFTAAMMAMAMPVAISPYSMAVAPDSFCKNLTIKAFIAALPLVVMPWNERCSRVPPP